MGFGDFVKKQFIDILEWTEETDEVLAWRFPTADREIQQGGQLIVRETQAAIFVHEGRVADTFHAGRHRIHTQNLPLLTDLRHWDKGFESPFKSEVYFFSLRVRIGRTWGTSQPVTVRDREFGAVRVRAHGVFSFRIADAERFFTAVSGTRPAYTVSELEGQLRATLVNAMAQHLGTSGVPFLDMAANQDALATGVRAKSNLGLAALGLEVTDAQIQSLSLPDELRQRLDERIGMGLVGDLGDYTRFQTARSIPVAAAQSGGAAGAGAGLGAGLAMGREMASALGSAASNRSVETRAAGAVAASPTDSSAGATPASRSDSSAAGTAATTGAGPITCPHCNSALAARTRFCPECGKSLG
jgi:membrane protease subunit (stomatin/prohibitin family)